jgi:hypothetical protein
LLAENRTHDADALSWLEELRRLSEEAAERFAEGRVLSALSSLAAIPPIHRMLVERCSIMLNDDLTDTENPLASTGMYI